MRNYQTKANEGAVSDSITPTKFGAGEFNSVATELENVVSSSNQTLAPADGAGEVTDQLSKAVAIYGASGAAYHIDTGAVNAYVLNPVSPRKSPPAYFDGFTLEFEPGSDNTAASTVNVASLGVKDIRDLTGAALTGGEITGSVIIRYNDAGGYFVIISSGQVTAAAFYDAYLKYSDVKATGVDGGASISGTQVRTLNTEDHDTAGIGSLSANQITLPAGTYITVFNCPYSETLGARAQLYDTTGASILVLGQTGYAISGERGIAIGNGLFTLSVSSILELRQYTASVIAGDGLGRACSDGNSEVYSIIEFWRLG